MGWVGLERLPHRRRPLLTCREDDFVLQHTIHVSILPSTLLPNKFCGGQLSDLPQLRRSIFFEVQCSMSFLRRTARVGAIFHPTHTNASMNREEWPAAVTCPPASSHLAQDPSVTHCRAIRQLSKVSRIEKPQQGRAHLAIATSCA